MAKQPPHKAPAEDSPVVTATNSALASPDTMADVRARAVTWGRAAAPWVLIVVIAGVLALGVAPKTSSSGRVLFGDVTVTGTGAGGNTRLNVPPVGSLDARTHDGPVGVRVRLDAVDINQLKATGNKDLQEARLIQQVEDGISRVSRTWFLQTLGLAGLLGLVTALAVSALLTPKRKRGLLARVAVGIIAGCLFWTAAGAVAWNSYDANAFSRPTYTGALRYAPEVLAASGGSYKGLTTVRDKTTIVADRLGALAQISGTNGHAASDGDVVLLHVSDIHLNPLGLEFARRIADQFRVDAIVDTGDFTSYGITPLEGQFAALINKKPPYYLSPGNHDSQAAIAAVVGTRRVTVVNNSVVDVKGLTIGGLSDPTFTPANNPPSKDSLAAAYNKQLPEITAFYKDRLPDVLMLHNPSQSKAVLGEPVTVLSGHIHKERYEISGKTRLAVAGTAGAGGLGSFSQTSPGIYQAEILRFRKDSAGTFQLWAVDRVTVDEDALRGTGPGRYSINRIDLTKSEAGRSYLTGKRAIATEGPVTADGSSVSTPSTSVVPPTDVGSTPISPPTGP